MKYGLYVVRDNQGDYQRPAIYLKEALAVRDFKFWMNGEESIQKFNPGDFDFYYVGDFDSDTGELLPSKPKLIIHGSEVINVQNEVRGA